MYLDSLPLLADDDAEAREAYDLARTHCTSCRSYHGIWPYLRLTGRKRGVDADRALLIPLLERIIADGARSVFLAGSADPGVLSMVLAAAGGCALSTTVVDLCETPLATCRTFAARRGATIRTLSGCLSEPRFHREHDLVVAHSVLSFIPPSLLSNVVANFAGTLVPGGRLLLTGGFSVPRTHAPTFCDVVLEGLSARGIDLPATESEFRALLAGYVENRVRRYSHFATADELVTFLVTHGFSIENVVSQARGTSVDGAGRVVERSNPGVVVVARRSNATR
ncbi:MAG: hypothetical protein K0R53_1558 [Burkholderiales bacterium]|nr:hypothetical protein [Burkholderiales bacterium]